MAWGKRNKETGKQSSEKGPDIKIIGSLDLSTRKYEPSAAELEKLRRENPLQAALYMTQIGQIEEAEQLAQEAYRRLRAEAKNDLTQILEARYETEQKNLEMQVQKLSGMKDSYREQIIQLQEMLKSLLSPPYGRAVLIDTFEVELDQNEEIIQINYILSALETLRINSTEVDEVIDLLQNMLAVLQEAEANKADKPHVMAAPADDMSDPVVVKEPLSGRRAIIAVGAGRYEVNIHPGVELPEEDPIGREVWTADKVMTIMKVSQEKHPTGIAAEVVKRLDNGRLQVKGRNGEEFVVQMTSELAMIEELEAGDIVRILPDAELGLALLEKSTKKLALDELPTESYDDIGGLEEQLIQIRDAIELPFLYRNVYQQYHLKRPKGILLYGPPGCGKTMIAKAIAKSLYDQTELALKQLQAALTLWLELSGSDIVPAEVINKHQHTEAEDDKQAKNNLDIPDELLTIKNASLEEARDIVSDFLNGRQIDMENSEAELRRVNNRLQEGAGSYFLSIKGPELLSKWVGEAEYSIRRIFTAAREKATQETPVVLFFDEIESMFSRRGSGRSSDMEKTIVPQLLAEIDGVDSMPNVLVIGASNRYDLIDPAVLRPGRLDVKIRIDRPDKKAAHDILSKYLTVQLPIDEKEMQQAGDQEEAVKALITKTINVIYNPGSQVVIYERRSKEGKRIRQGTVIRKVLTEVVSGAMLANTVERAKRNAAKRAIEGGTGINWVEDLLPAIKQECEESKDQYVFEARKGDMAYVDVDQFEAEIILEGEAEGERPVARWVRFKKRPWYTSNA